MSCFFFVWYKNGRGGIAAMPASKPSRKEIENRSSIQNDFDSRVLTFACLDRNLCSSYENVFQFQYVWSRVHLPMSKNESIWIHNRGRVGNTAHNHNYLGHVYTRWGWPVSKLHYHKRRLYGKNSICLRVWKCLQITTYCKNYLVKVKVWLSSNAFFTFVYCTKCILKTDGSHGKRDEKYPPFTYEKWASLDMVQLITVIQNVIIIHNTTTMPLMYLSSTYYFQEIWTLDCLLKNKLGLHMNVSRIKCIMD